MDIASVVFIAIGLAMDSAAISMAYGTVIDKHRRANALKFCISFGIFHTVMPVVGWFAGGKIAYLVANIDHWITFGLLAYIGVKMYFDASNKQQSDSYKCAVPYNTILGLSIVTSIDTLAVGFSFALLKVNIITPVLIIGITAFAMSLAGFILGNRFGCVFQNKMGKIAGIIIVLVGVKILVQGLLG